MLYRLLVTRIYCSLLIVIQEVVTDGNQSWASGVPKTHEVISEDSEDFDDTGESSDQAEVNSDEDWEPRSRFILFNGFPKKVEAVENLDDDLFPLPVKHKHLCDECGAFFAPHRRHTCEHKIKPFSCSICGQRLATEYALNAHRRTHNENYLFRCKYCDLTVKTKVDKINHEQIHLHEEKPYKCPDCSETFATHTERKVHLEDHRGPPQLKCDFCGMEFLKTVRLQRHLLVHTGAKPFECSVCQRRFSQASHLKSHVRLHTGERPFKCQQCDKSFNHNSCLKNHIQRYHTAKCGYKLKDRKSERENQAGDTEGRGEHSQPSNAKREAKKGVAKLEKTTTGRPIGRPKKNASDSSLSPVKEECSYPDTIKPLKGSKHNGAQTNSAWEFKDTVQMTTTTQSRKRGRPRKTVQKEKGKKSR